MTVPTWLWATVGPTIYDLTGNGILWQEHSDGFGLPPMHRFTQRGPGQHGETNRDFRLDPRTITLVSGVARPCEADIYNARRRLLDIFRPSNSPILLRWDLSNGTVRQIDAYYSGGMTLPIGSAAAGAVASQNQSGQTRYGSQGVYQRTAIELFCPDPTFYDPTLRTVTITNTDAGDGLVIPLTVPVFIGRSIMPSAGETIAYAGDWLSYPTIRLIGPLTDPVLTQVTTDEVLDFTGATIGLGDYWDIDLSYGAKTVTDAAGNSQIAWLSDDSDLATFHLAPAPDAASTYNNEIHLAAVDAASVSAARISWYDRFVGF